MKYKNIEELNFMLEKMRREGVVRTGKVKSIKRREGGPDIEQTTDLLDSRLMTGNFRVNKILIEIVFFILTHFLDQCIFNKYYNIN